MYHPIIFYSMMVSFFSARNVEPGKSEGKRRFSLNTHPLSFLARLSSSSIIGSSKEKEKERERELRERERIERERELGEREREVLIFSSVNKKKLK